VRENKGLVTGLGILQAFIGIGAVAGGLPMILDPSGSKLGMSLEMLEHSPFATFLVPGIVLLVVNGIGSLIGATASFKKYRRAGEIAIALGLFLIAWIVIQVYWLASFHWLHGMYLSLGILEFILGWFMRKALRKGVDIHQ
jgi:hypothetical protein